MASRLFQTLVVSSTMLLSAACGEVVRAEDDGGREDAVSAQDAPARDVSLVTRDATARDVVAADTRALDASAPRPDASATDAALHDARRREAGWPTTKGSFCASPEAGPSFCCSYTGPGEGPRPYCCIINPDDDSCVRCVVNATETTCDPDSPALLDAGGAALDAGGEQ